MIETVQIIIDNPADADNIAPTFDPTGWIETITIFCDEKSSSFDKCGEGVEINLLDFFNDSDGTGPESSHMVFDIYNDPSTAIDDDYAYHIRITPDGIAIYNPMDSMYQTSGEISEWSMQGVTFEARDAFDSAAYSYQVNFIVRSVEFTAQREDSGSIEPGNPALFTGTGLPKSVVYAKLLDGGDTLNYTVVRDDGIWTMEISSTDLADGSFDIYFEQDDDQTLGYDDGNRITLTKGDEGGDGIGTWVWVVIAIVAFTILLGVGAFFFLEFEEEFEDDPEAQMERNKRRRSMRGPKQGLLNKQQVI